MCAVIVWNLMTLDGCFEGKEPWDRSFHEDAWNEELEELAIEQLAAADALLSGRTTYEGMAAHWPTANLIIFGSAKLCASLIPAGLIDIYRVCIVPGLLGEGRPLFPAADPRAKTTLRLLDSWTTAKGCIVASCAPLTSTR